MKKMLTILSSVAILLTAQAKAESTSDSVQILQTCSVYRQSFEESLKGYPDFVIALYKGRVFVYSPANSFIQLPETDQNINIGFLTTATAMKDPASLTTRAFEARLTPLTKKRIQQVNLPELFMDKTFFSQETDLTITSHRGIALKERPSSETVDFSNVILAHSDTHNVNLAFMSYDGSKYHLSHVCR